MKYSLFWLHAKCTWTSHILSLANNIHETESTMRQLKCICPWITLALQIFKSSLYLILDKQVWNYTNKTMLSDARCLYKFAKQLTQSNSKYRKPKRITSIRGWGHVLSHEKSFLLTKIQKPLKSTSCKLSFRSRQKL